MVQSLNDHARGVEIKATGTDEATIQYNGLLVKSGADCVYLHMGHGSPQAWSNVTTVKMDKHGSGFEKVIKVSPRDVVQVCFKDSAANWDNNSGNNWAIH